MPRNVPGQTIDLAGLKISLKTYGELTFFFDIANGFESLSDVADRAFREWLAQQGAAIRMNQIDVQFMADHRTEGDVMTVEMERRVPKAKREARTLPANVARIDSSFGFARHSSTRT
jgi:hypothetical protein